MSKRKATDPSLEKSLRVSQCTRSKKPRLNVGLNYNSKDFPWITATSTYNYMVNDPLIDWLEADHRPSRPRSDSITQTETFESFLMRKGIDFEAKVVNYIHENINPVVKVAEFYSPEGVDKTKSLMEQGVPFLHSAPLANPRTRSYGVADLIVRSDYVSRLIQEGFPTGFLDSIHDRCSLSDSYHYVVIDIKFSTLPLNSTGNFLLNQGSFSAYKAQIWMYNQAIGHIQKYVPKYGFVLGRRWNYTQRGEKFSNFSCLSRLGAIDFKGYDSRIITKARKAVRWSRDVKQNGFKWKTNPPSRIELYPNMCRDSGKWNKYKRNLSQQLGEITSVWMCGPKNRKIAFENGYKDWRNPRVTSDDLGIRGNRGEIIDKMLSINRQRRDKVLPLIVNESTFAWKSHDNEVFVDFETFSDVFSDFDSLPLQKPSNLIYHIGVGWFDAGNNWKYRYFICHRPDSSEEFRIMKEFSDFLVEKGNPYIYYWHAEKHFWKTACEKQFDRSSLSDEQRDEIVMWGLNHQLKDLRKLFVDEKVVVQGCFGFGLKEIARCLKSHNLISTRLESECSNGRTAMIQAWRAYTRFERPWKSGVMKDVTQYNEYDCRLLGDILTYLRRNHSGTTRVSP